MMPHQTKLLFLLLSIVFFSCRKQQPKCKTNCYDMTFSGRAFVKTNGAAMAGLPVTVQWFKRGNCIGCTVYDVVSGVTDQNGNFSLSATIDTSFFSDHHLSIRLGKDTNFLNNPMVESSPFLEERRYSFTPSGLQNLQFEFYPKTYLTIRLRRTQNDVFENFSITHQYIPSVENQVFSLNNPQLAKDTVLKVPTSADVYTKVNWLKIVNGQVSRFTDSLICTANGPNIFDINY